MKKSIIVFCLLAAAVLFSQFLLVAASGSSAVLDGIYATSVSGNNGAYNLIDGNEKTSWVLMPGAGVDEGVMFNFADFNFIRSLKISAPAGKISSFEIYVNGSICIYDAKSGSDIVINRNVKTLYIKINKAASGTLSLNEIYLYDKTGGLISCQAPEVLNGRIEGSSVLDPEEAYNYDFLFDSKREFGWADGNTKLSGENEFIKFHFDKKVNIVRIKIWNGYHRSKTHFDKNEAVQTFTFSDSKNSGRYSLSSSFVPQEVDFGKVFSGKDFTFTVNSVRKGSAYKDLVISELLFYDGKKWFIMATGKPEQRKNSVISRSRSGVLNDFLDKRKTFSVNSSGRILEQSLILRSNGSFVVYKKDVTDSSSKNVIGDGNWQIVKNSSASAEVKIFGRMRKIIETSREVEVDEDEYDPYGGKRTSMMTVKNSSDEEVIFSDVLDITQNSVISRKKIIEPMKF
ncbi:MAG: hypothetical protein JW982_02175 [Spirochaetes bacterium]|nr:hypothetical protein [Spirochaetota bacterium]